MFNSLYISATGMEAQQMRMDTVANNLANVNTTGFRAASAHFEDLYSQSLGENGEGALGLQQGLGARTAGISRSQVTGNLQETGNTFDLAIAGEGYFELEDASGNNYYTRAGQFNLDAEGRLVHQSGNLISGNIQIPEGASQVVIQNDGTVNAWVPESALPIEAGVVDIVKFANPQALEAQGHSLFSASDAAGEAQRSSQQIYDNTFGTVRQGMLESSNVNMVSEMVKMLETQRAYQINSKVMTAADEMLGYANNLRR